jgi:hypothetical protein
MARQGDAELSVAREAVGHHAAVARLEDVKREGRAGKEDHCEGENGEAGEHGGI